jgi:predicted RNase H-like HicB family nuclease
MKYTAILQRESDGGYVATVPARLVSSRKADSRAEILKNIAEVIELYLEDIREEGEPIPVGTDCEYVKVATFLA